MFLAKLVGMVRNLAVPNLSEGEPGQPLALNARGELLCAQSLPPKSALATLGNTWQVSIATGQAFTHVAAWPTTRAELLLWNGEAAGGKTYIIDALWYANVATSVAAATQGTLLAQLVPVATAPTDDANQLIVSRCGRGTNYQGKARRAVANTSYGIASKWEVVGQFGSGSSTATIGMGCYADLFGGWLVPPGAVFLANAALGTAAGTGSLGIVWHEVQMPIP